jgi:hypothetical protein
MIEDERAQARRCTSDRSCLGPCGGPGCRHYVQAAPPSRDQPATDDQR